MFALCVRARVATSPRELGGGRGGSAFRNTDGENSDYVDVGKRTRRLVANILTTRQFADVLKTSVPNPRVSLKFAGDVLAPKELQAYQSGTHKLPHRGNRGTSTSKRLEFR